MPQIIVCEWRIIFSENLLYKISYPFKDPCPIAAFSKYYTVRSEHNQTWLTCLHAVLLCVVTGDGDSGCGGAWPRFKLIKSTKQLIAVNGLLVGHYCPTSCLLTQTLYLNAKTLFCVEMLTESKHLVDDFCCCSATLPVPPPRDSSRQDTGPRLEARRRTVAISSRRYKRYQGQ